MIYELDRYQQDFEGVPVVDDDVVLTYDKDGELVSAYGMVENLSEKKNGHPCEENHISLSKEEAIQKIKDDDAEKNGKGTYHASLNS